MATLVLTVLGDDRAGLVSAVAAPLKAHGAGWERSQMARLAGKFAGIVEVVVPDDRVDALVPDLEALSSEGLRVTVERTAEPAQPTTARLRLDLVGADHPGIVADISALLADRDVSVEEFSSDLGAAPMSGAMLFVAHAVLAAPTSLSVTELRASLESLADELMVEIALVDE